jgi:hypothetical protein
MSVRVVETAERRLLAWLVALPMGLLTAAVLLYMVPLDDLLGRYAAFGVPCALWSLGLLLTRRARPWIDHVRLPSGEDQTQVIQLTRRGSIAFSSVALARAHRGFSVAMGLEGGRGLFLEVENEADARR